MPWVPIAGVDGQEAAEVAPTSVIPMLLLLDPKHR
jgi:hypothetical protein